MSSPSSTTILLVSATRLVRGDFESANGSLLGWWTAERTPGLNMVEGARAALALGGKAGHSVWVLCEDLWTQNIELAKGQISGLSPEQIRRALAFEVEPFSGMPVTDSVVGFSESEDRDGMKSFWIAEISLTQREAIHSIVRVAGGQLNGIGHPGGVPRPMDANLLGRSWRRLESWHGTLVWLQCQAGQSVRARVLTSSPSLWQAPPDSTLELLSADQGSAIANLEVQSSGESYFLDDEEHLKAWLTAWASAVRDEKAAVPLIPAPAPKPTPTKYIVTGVALEVAAIVLLGTWLTIEIFQLARLKRERAEILRTNEQVQAVNKENTALRKEIADLEQKAAKLAVLSERRGALPMLLRTLASTRPDDVVLSGIRPGASSNLIVSGLALEAVSVDEMSTVLTETLRPAGWFAQPLQKTAKRTLPNSGPWEFSISVSQESTVRVNPKVTAGREP